MIASGYLQTYPLYSPIKITHTHNIYNFRLLGNPCSEQPLSGHEWRGNADWLFWRSHKQASEHPDKELRTDQNKDSINNQLGQWIILLRLYYRYRITDGGLLTGTWIAQRKILCQEVHPSMGNESWKLNLEASCLTWTQLILWENLLSPAVFTTYITCL